jgi:ATP-dependent helicase/nuclease subunit A
MVKKVAEVRWTEDQQKAIDTHGCNLLVAAAAGSGKTAVLVERIIKMITNMDNPIDIDRLLVVTFTNAAASEMRERIAEAISKEIHNNKYSSKFQRQLTLLNRASITTIHSFCLQVIRNNFHQIDLDPGFRIADDTETVLLKQEVIEELFEDKYLLMQIDKNNEFEDINEVIDEYVDTEYPFDSESYEENRMGKCTSEEFLSLVECYCDNRDDSALQHMIKSIYNFSMSMPYPEQWIIEKSEEFDINDDYSFGESKWAKILMGDIYIELKGMEKVMLRALHIINELQELQPYYDTFSSEYAMLEDCIKACEIGWDSLIKSLQDVSFGRLKTIKNCSDKAKQKMVKDIRDNVKKQLNGLKQQMVNASSKESIKDLMNMHNIISALCKLTLEFKEKFSNKKKERAIIDFNDIEHLCLEILIARDEEGNIILDSEGRYVPSAAAEELREKYEEILIDEYQDSNMVQEVLLNIISKERLGNPNVFMVGDVKQSIYRFRQAKPELFLDKYNRYSKKEGEIYRKITLYKNFRSRKEILDGVNYIFEQIMSESIGELNYDESEALNLGASYSSSEEVDGVVGGEVELHLIEKAEKEAFEGDENKQEESDDDKEALTNIELEARMAALRIKEIMKQKDDNTFKIFDKHNKEYRPVQFRDIVILLRSTQNWAPVFMEELKKYDIPVYADTGSGYFQTIEIQTMMSLLQIIDNPRQDISMLSVMRSPIGGFTPEEFVNIRIVDKHISFYEAAIRARDNGQLTIDNEKSKKEIINDEQIKKDNDESEENIKIAEKLKEFFNKLDIWREKSIHMPIDEFIWYLYKETGYYGFVGAMSAGLQRQANLKILFQRARQFEKTSYNGLFNFINFINKLKKNSGDMGSAKVLGENENVVRIMSIHKSKGLEFPVVFLCGCGKKFNLMDLNKKILLHHDLGFGPDYIDVLKRITYPTIVKQAIKKKILLESLSEEMRILYVALTRAKEKMIITGTVNDIQKYCDKWSDSASSEDEKIPEYYILKGRSYLDWIVSALMRHSDCKALREAAGFEDYEIKGLLQHDSKWQMHFWDRSSIEEDEQKSEVEDEELDIFEKIDRLINKNHIDVDDTDIDMEDDITDEEISNIRKMQRQKNKEYRQLIEKRLDFKYEFIECTELPTAITVTELKRRLNAQTIDTEKFSKELYVPKLLKKPSFLEETKGLSAAERGTAMHDVMQYLDLNRVGSREEILKQLNELVYKQLITEEQSAATRIDKVLKFFNSSLGRRIIKADAEGKLRKEVPFSYEISCTEVYRELCNPKYQGRYDNETIKLQGIIDCYFEEDGKIILLDYKTDYVENGEVQPIIERYRNQIKYYVRALEFKSDKEVSEKYLYLFSIDKVVEVE